MEKWDLQAELFQAGFQPKVNRFAKLSEVSGSAALEFLGMEQDTYKDFFRTDLRLGGKYRFFTSGNHHLSLTPSLLSRSVENEQDVLRLFNASVFSAGTFLGNGLVLNKSLSATESIAISGLSLGLEYAFDWGKRTFFAAVELYSLSGEYSSNSFFLNYSDVSNQANFRIAQASAIYDMSGRVLRLGVRRKINERFSWQTELFKDTSQASLSEVEKIEFDSADQAPLGNALIIYLLSQGGSTNADSIKGVKLRLIYKL